MLLNKRGMIVRHCVNVCMNVPRARRNTLWIWPRIQQGSICDNLVERGGSSSCSHNVSNKSRSGERAKAIEQVNERECGQ